LLVSLEGVAATKNKKGSRRKKRLEKEFEFLITGDVIIKQGEQTDPIPLLKNNSTKPRFVEVTIFGEETKFLDAKTAFMAVSPAGVFTLPIIKGSTKGYEEAGILISIDGRKVKNIRIATNTIKDWKKLNTLIDSDNRSKKGALIRNEVFMVLDMEKMDPSVFIDGSFSDDTGISIETTDPDYIEKDKKISRSSDSGNEIITYGPDEGGQTFYPRGVCLRRYDPYIPNVTTPTRNSHGIVYWNAGNPSRQGYSIKDENNSSGYTSALRCPKGVGQYDYLVDGIYKKTWLYLPYKVPNHCTATKDQDSNGRDYMRCCCNSAFSLAYGVCGHIDARQFGDWPDAPKTTCR